MKKRNTFLLALISGLILAEILIWIGAIMLEKYGLFGYIIFNYAFVVSLISSITILGFTYTTIKHCSQYFYSSTELVIQRLNNEYHLAKNYIDYQFNHPKEEIAPERKGRLIIALKHCENIIEFISKDIETMYNALARCYQIWPINKYNEPVGIGSEFEKLEYKRRLNE